MRRQNVEGAITDVRINRMYLSEAIDTIRERLQEHKISRKRSLWAIIVKQTAKDGCFDGHLVDPILELIDALLAALTDEAMMSMWEETEVGMVSEWKAIELFVEDLKEDLRMEILDQVTKLAWQEAQEGQ